MVSCSLSRLARVAGASIVAGAGALGSVELDSLVRLRPANRSRSGWWMPLGRRLVQRRSLRRLSLPCRSPCMLRVLRPATTESIQAVIVRTVSKRLLLARTTTQLGATAPGFGRAGAGGWQPDGPRR